MANAPRHLSSGAQQTQHFTVIDHKFHALREKLGITKREGEVALGRKRSSLEDRETKHTYADVIIIYENLIVFYGVATPITLWLQSKFNCYAGTVF